MSMHVKLVGVRIDSIDALKNLVTRLNQLGRKSELFLRLEEHPHGRIELNISEEFTAQIFLLYKGTRPALNNEHQLLNGHFEMSYDGDFRTIVEKVIGKDGSYLLELYNREKALLVTASIIEDGTFTNPILTQPDQIEQQIADLEHSGYIGTQVFFYEENGTPKSEVVTFSHGVN